MSGAALSGVPLDPIRKRMTPTRMSMQSPDASPGATTAAGDPPVEVPAAKSASSIAQAAETESASAPAVAPHPAPGSDADVLTRAQAGDHHAFAQLYALHKRRIYSLCLRMVGNVAEAEDLTQEAFLQLHRKIGTFRGDSAFSTWLHRLSINVVLMHLRKNGLPLMSLDDAIEPSYDDGPCRGFGAP